MRIEVEKRKANIVTICDVCKVKLTSENRAHHASEDHRHGAGASLELSIYIYSNEYPRDSGSVKGKILDDETHLCKECHKAVIEWYLDHIEPGSSI